jgi:nicotinate-nucleotide adenylyltransferase
MEVESSTLAIFGGTFNPIHHGHISIAASAKHEFGYGRILFIPSSIPAHKEADPFTADNDRIAMMVSAIGEIDYIHIDTCEIDRGGISYMIDTVDYIDAHYDYTGRPGLIIGDDLLTGFHKWRRADELVERVDLIIARRTSVQEQEFSFPHRYLNNPIVNAASRDIRDFVAHGRCFNEYVPSGVSRYIDEHQLYREV